MFVLKNKYKELETENIVLKENNDYFKTELGLEKQRKEYWKEGYQDLAKNKKVYGEIEAKYNGLIARLRGFLNLLPGRLEGAIEEFTIPEMIESEGMFDEDDS